MKVAFATTQSKRGSTMIGRVLPLAHELAQRGHDCTILGLGSSSTAALAWESVGSEPFVRTAAGKRRLGGWRLIWNMLSTAVRTGGALVGLRPDVVVVVKTLPANVLGAWLYRGWCLLLGWRVRFVLDVDDFELTANQLSSLLQRAAVHWAERAGVRLATTIAAASPFLADHFALLSPAPVPIVLVPTGLTLPGADSFAPTSAKPVLTYVGSVSLSSGHRVDLLPAILARVRKRVPKARLLMLGDGDDVTTLREQFAQAGVADAVDWGGRFAVRDLPMLLKNIAVVLDPIDASVAQRAKSSFRVMLAATLGLPVVSSNIGVRPHQLPATLHDRFFAMPADVDGYVDRVCSLLDQPLSRTDQTTLREHSQQFTWKILADTYAKRVLV